MICFIQKLASLGVLSAGIAHELNNPSSAVARSAKELEPARAEVVGAARALGAAQLSDAQLAAIELLDCSEDSAAADLRSPLDRADREDAIADWLDGRGIDPGLAEPLRAHDRDDRAAGRRRRVRSTGARSRSRLRYVAANLSARRLTGEIVKAAERIHELAARVKKQTHMDRAPVVDAIPLEESLADTLALIGSKARSKAVTLELKVEPNLPRLQGVLGELNQVWLNLIDNAIDAAPEGGHVTVAAGHERDSIVVRVIDDGAGNRRGGSRPDFRPVLYDEAGRPGHRPRAPDGAGHRPQPPWHDPGRIPAGPYRVSRMPARRMRRGQTNGLTLGLTPGLTL